MRQTELCLGEEELRQLESFRSRGWHRAREINRAHILVGLHKKIPEASLMQVLGVARTALWRTRAAYHEGGWPYAVHDLPRPGQPKKYQTPEEAQIVALACSQPPKGAKRWTLKELTRAARELPKMPAISGESVRRMLKKTRSSPGAR